MYRVKGTAELQEFGKIMNEFLEYWNYNSECFSARDGLNCINAENEYAHILDKLIIKGFEVEKIEAFKNITFEPVPFTLDDAELIGKSRMFESCLKAKGYNKFLTEDKILVTTAPYCQILDIGNSRFDARLYESSHGAIEKCEEDELFKKAEKYMGNLRDFINGKETGMFAAVNSNPRLNTKRELLIMSLHDNFGDSSSYYVKLSSNDIHGTRFIEYFINVGGFYQDIIIKELGNVQYVIPLYDKGYISCHTISKAPYVAENFRKEMAAYKEQIEQFNKESEVA